MIAAQLGAVQAKYEMVERSVDFAQIARCLLAGNGRFEQAADLARMMPRVSDRVKGFFSKAEARDVFERTAVPPATIATTPALTEYRIAANGFAASLANVGVFDRLLGAGFHTLPMSLVSTGAVNVGAVAATVDEAAPKPVSSLSLTAASPATVRKSSAILILTDELARAIDGMVDTIIGRELRVACVRAIDAKFLAIATAGAPSFAASGTNLPAFFGDLAAAMNSVAIDDTSVLYVAMTSTNAKQLSLMLAQSASPSTMTPSGGAIAGIPVVVSDSLAAGTWVLLDASAFAAASDVLRLTTLRHASVQMDTAPDSPATASTNFLSLWQLNQLGLLCERFWICERLRTNSVAQITGASYASGFSP